MSRLRLVSLLLSMLALFPAVSAATLWDWYSQANPATATLYAVHAVDANTAFAVGIGGSIIKTTDAGQTWTKLDSATNVSLSSVYFLDANTGWAAGGNTIVSTTDGGTTWVPQSVSASAITAIAFPTVSIGVAVGNIGSQGFLRTTDGGQNWTQLDVGNSGSNRPQDVFFLDAQRGWAVGINADRITTTCDPFGSCSTTYTNLFSRIWSTTDGGATWATRARVTNGWLRGISFADATKGWIVGNAGGVMKTADGGATWSSRTSGTSANLYGVDFADALAGWAVGSGGAILHSADGGDTWTVQISGTNSMLYSVDFASRTSGWAVGAGGVVLRTENGGPCSLEIGPTSASIAAAGEARAVSVSTDAGCPWTAVSNVPWISITSGSTGSGSGSVSYAVTANSGASRQGSMEIAGWPFSVVQIGSRDELTFSLLAGAGVVGSTDGTGNAARFYYPMGVAVDGSGNVYVADSNNHTIRKITPEGVAATLAGTAGSYGSADGTGSAARFYYPWGVAVDASGNVYVADSWNDTIRMITPAGVVTTLAGTPGYLGRGGADGTGSAAQFNYPRGLAVDASGNVYVADWYNGTIRKITPAGVVTTLAGTAGSSGSNDGTGSAARFFKPEGVAVDGSGNVYVADTQNHTIRKITPAGVVTTLAGRAGYWGSADGTGSAARFYLPGAVAVDGSGNVYVADTQNHTIRLVSPAGFVATAAGLAGNSGFVDGKGSIARFNFPMGIVVGGSGNIYVGDTRNHAVRQAAALPPSITSIAPASGPPAGETAVTISGSGFAEGATVRFGSANATGLDVTSTSIAAITPAGIGVVDVTVANPDGQSAALPNGFTYIEPPSITSIAPASGPAAGGTAVTISGSNFVAGATVRFGSAYATGLGVTSNSITATTPAGSGVVDVTVMNPGGQSAALTNAFTYEPPPLVISIAPTSGTINGGTAVTINGANFAIGATTAFGGTAATNVTFVNSATTTATTPAHAAGLADVMVVNPDGQSGVLASAFNFTNSPNGDVNGDGNVDMSDVFYLINSLFTNGPNPVGSGDVNGDGRVDVADLVYMINYLVAGGPGPQ